MDNDVLRRTYRDINERFCPYEKAILTNHCECSQARRFLIAEREGINCGSDTAQQRCLVLLELVRQRARFALKATDERAALPHGKAMRVQVGGLRGLRQALVPDEPAPARIEDIFGLIDQAVARFGDLGSLPFQPIIQQIAAFKGRRRLRRLR